MLWREDTLKPLFAELVPVAERFDIESLKSAARKVSPAAVALVAEKGSWNPVAKTALITGGAATTAKYLNKAGVSAETVPEVTLVIAVVAILAGRSFLLNELKEMAAEKQSESPRGGEGAARSLPSAVSETRRSSEDRTGRVQVPPLSTPDPKPFGPPPVMAETDGLALKIAKGKPNEHNPDETRIA